MFDQQASSEALSGAACSAPAGATSSFTETSTPTRLPNAPIGSTTSAALAAIRCLAHIDTRACTTDERLASVLAIEKMRSLLDTFQAHLLADLEADGTTDVRFGMRTPSWVASQTGCARGPVAGRLRVGRALRAQFNKIDDALTNGQLCFDHAKTLVDASNPRTRDALAAAQDQIIALAKDTTFDQWRNDITALAEVADTDGPEPDPYADLSLSMPVTLDRTVHIDGTLDHASGLAFRQAIKTKTDELFRRFTRDREHTPDLEIPKRSVLRALALIELIREATSAKPGSGTAPRAEITLVAHNHQISDTNGVPLPQAAADVWGCDPDMWAVVVDHMRIPVDVGHTNRLATVAQRHAIATRDGGCTFPGCDAPISWCDHHHVTDWRYGGPTDLDNLVALCRHHHGITHRNGWAMHLDDKQIPHWTTPSGDHLTGQRHHRQPPGHRQQHPPDAHSPDAHPPNST